MLQVAIEDIEVGPGHVYEWALTSLRTDGGEAAAGQRSITGFNQAKHFTVAQHAQSVNDPVRSYVAGTFTLPGPVDLDALEASILDFVRRHEVLRSVYHPLAGDVSCDILRPDEVALERSCAGRLDSAEEVRRHLHATFKRVDTLAWPLIVMGVVLHEDSATVYFSCDHLVTDGLSTVIAVNDISSAYAARTLGRPRAAAEVGSYLAFSRDQRRQNRALDADDERLDHWRGFIARSGSFFPRFPLELGVEPGRLYTSVNETEHLLDADETAALESHCRTAGGRLSMGLLAALAMAIRAEGGPEVYRGLMPVNERGRGEYAEAVGWFINTLPIEFAVGPGSSFTEVLANAEQALATMRAHADVHFVKAWRLLAPVEYANLRFWPHAVNFFSYLDFRRTPGAEHHGALRPRTHVWVSGCNGLLLWLHRNDDGLHLNSIYVDTPQAARTKSALVHTLTRTLRSAYQPVPLPRPRPAGPADLARRVPAASGTA
ncbi:condensation domain-containing protein [Kitasatospora sp. NPDC002040]|uniref:condensation domain-containing protein n=1 Tax=Kitasatospora sp. NPDC002040 TaxID=3154661 RepID=UPI003322ED05